MLSAPVPVAIPVVFVASSEACHLLAPCSFVVPRLLCPLPLGCTGQPTRDGMPRRSLTPLSGPCLPPPPCMHGTLHGLTAAMYNIGGTAYSGPVFYSAQDYAAATGGYTAGRLVLAGDMRFQILLRQSKQAPAADCVRLVHLAARTPVVYWLVCAGRGPLCPTRRWRAQSGTPLHARRHACRARHLRMHVLSHSVILPTPASPNFQRQVASASRPRCFMPTRRAVLRAR